MTEVRGDRPLLRRIRRQDDRPGAIVALLLVLIALAIAKPWGEGAPTRLPAIGAAPPAAGGAAVSAARDPTPSATLSVKAIVAEECNEPAGWQIHDEQSWNGRRARVWESVPAVRAAGPLDPGIVFAPVVGDAVPTLGFCAPVTNLPSPDPGAVPLGWGLVGAAAGATSPFDATPLVLVRVAPSVSSPLGALYAPPAALAGSPGSWRAGRYVFEVGGWWFGAEVRIFPPAAVPNGRPAGGSGG